MHEHVARSAVRKSCDAVFNGSKEQWLDAANDDLFECFVGGAPLTEARNGFGVFASSVGNLDSGGSGWNDDSWPWIDGCDEGGVGERVK
jgi:hypothetical protein